MNLEDLKAKAEGMGLEWDSFKASMNHLCRGFKYPWSRAEKNYKGWNHLATTVLGAFDPDAPSFEVRSIGLDEEGVYRYAHHQVEPPPDGMEWVLVLRRKEGA